MTADNYNDYQNSSNKTPEKLSEKVSYLVSKVKHPTRHVTGHFGDESLHTINCTGTDTQTYDNQQKHRKY